MGNKDAPRNDIPCFTERDESLSPLLNAKLYKVLPHLIWHNVEWSVWVDANITLKVDPEVLVKMTTKDIGVFPHPDRNCIYEEANYCIHYGIGDKKKIEEQMKRYEKEGFPKGYGMAMCGILVIKHTTEMKQLCEKWWAEICRGSYRDQLSFPYVFKDKVSYFPYQKNIKDNQYFHRTSHNGKTL